MRLYVKISKIKVAFDGGPKFHADLDILTDTGMTLEKHGHVIDLGAMADVKRVDLEDQLASFAISSAVGELPGIIFGPSDDVMIYGADGSLRVIRVPAPVQLYIDK